MIKIQFYFEIRKSKEIIISILEDQFILVEYNILRKNKVLYVVGDILYVYELYVQLFF